MQMPTSSASVAKSRLEIAVLPGDGLGPEISEATIEVISTLNRALDLKLDFTTHVVGLARLKSDGCTLPPAVMEAVKSAAACILGPVQHSDYPPRAAGGVNVSSELRMVLDLYANIRPSRSRPALPHWGRTEMDLVIVRENTEGFYSDRNMFMGPGEFMPTPDLALSVRKITAHGSRRIAQAAFQVASQRRKKVTAVHKANVIKVSEALFLREVRKVAEEFPGIGYDEQLIDSMSALLVRDAARYDVIVTTNMFGDILSDLAAELSGSIGLAGSINAGEHHCVAQAQHGSAPDIAGKDRANPCSLILSAAMLLTWLGERRDDPKLVEAGRLLTSAVDQTIENPANRTTDIGGSLGTKAFTGALVQMIHRELAKRA